MSSYTTKSAILSRRTHKIMMAHLRKAWPLIGLLGLGLAACAEAELAAPATTPETRPAEPSLGGPYKVGSPYRVNDVWYYPKVDYGYSETGIASWYGPGFDGRRTANGEVYDQHALTAAHRTLPMPSIVRVTNLENGRSVKVRINDRGPFKAGRIIDLSRRAADLLGFRGRGTAKVRVEVVEDESRRLAALGLSDEAAALAPDAAPIEPVSVETLPAVNGHPAPTEAATPAASQTAAAYAGQDPTVEADPEAPSEPDGMVLSTPVGRSDIYVQAGAFRRFDNANRLRARLSSLGNVRIAEADIDDRRFFRVRIGPMRSVEAADRMLDILIANGHTDATIIVD